MCLGAPTSATPSFSASNLWVTLASTVGVSARRHPRPKRAVGHEVEEWPVLSTIRLEVDARRIFFDLYCHDI